MAQITGEVISKIESLGTIAINSGYFTDSVRHSSHVMNLSFPCGAFYQKKLQWSNKRPKTLKCRYYARSSLVNTDVVQNVKVAMDSFPGKIFSDSYQSS